MPHAPCPMPHAQCPMPNAPCPMPHAQCPMPNLYASCGSSSNIDIHRRLEKEEENISDTFSSSEGCN
ncbi:hypothetical protein [Nostoc sp. CHAB 5715]|uniref:hypothetical protein n=1 Tax=Nostoc sp. CHAB 5715 TaxID=2780400 RepID=UPI001E4FE185|nr:hypothetical protein [Nostoc sp. CHAB 5715]